MPLETSWLTFLSAYVLERTYHSWTRQSTRCPDVFRHAPVREFREVVLLDDISLDGDYDLSPHPVRSADDTAILQ